MGILWLRQGPHGRGATDFKAQTVFRPCNTGRADGWGCDNPSGPPAGTDFVEFQNWGGGTWNGPLDHSTAITMAWTPNNMYMGIKAADDLHTNANSGWQGDTVQVMFTSAARAAGTPNNGEASGIILFNYGMQNDGVGAVVHLENHPCLTGDSCTKMGAYRQGAHRARSHCRFVLPL